MWHIFIDKSDRQYLVLHFDVSDVSDFLLRSHADGRSADCWVHDILDYDTVDDDEDPCPLDDYSELPIIHSFESDDPLTYIQSLPQTHPELFI